MSLLIAEGLSKSYGGINAVANVTMSIPAGARHVVLGPNGAGKSTLFQLLSGAVLPSAGRIKFRDTDISQLPAYKRARLGIARTFQITSLFTTLSVEENLRLALQPHQLSPRRFLPWRRSSRVEAERSSELLDTWGLSDVRHHVVSSLSYGMQRSLEIVMALGRQPKMILLDEPTAGLASSEVGALIRVLQRLPQDVAVILIDHDMDVVREIATRITVLHRGQVIREAEPTAIFSDADIRKLYMKRGPARPN